jgi:hypothetical protein
MTNCKVFSQHFAGDTEKNSKETSVRKRGVKVDLKQGSPKY